MTTGIIRFSKFDFDAVSDNLNADARRIVGKLSTAMIKITEHDARIEESLTSNVGKLIQPLAQLSTPMNVMVHIAGTNLEVTTISPSAQSLDSRRTWEPDAKTTASEVDDSCIWTSSLIAARVHAERFCSHTNTYVMQRRARICQLTSLRYSRGVVGQVPSLCCRSRILLVLSRGQQLV